MAGLKTTIQRYWKRKPFEIGWDDYLALAIALIGAFGFISGPVPFIPGWTDAYHQVRAELIGIGVSVLIIANANEAVKRREEKERLILQMGSPDNAFAIEAVRQLRARGWLEDGSLNGAYLVNANLSEAEISEADLYKVNLAMARLHKANLAATILTEAHLQGAHLPGANLARANLARARLFGADLRWAFLHQAVLNEAKYDNQTQWPEGFDPGAAGAVKLD